MRRLFTIPTAFALVLAFTPPAFAGTVNVVADGQKFTFSPNVVTLKKGQPTTIHFKATPGAPHGLNVPALGISNVMIPSAGTDVKVDPKKAGTYAAHCTIVCGSGHDHMAMKFIVK
ncbi:MAG: hypothetical protein NVS2B17_04520 [Candidatus Velthaea sp.]